MFEYLQSLSVINQVLFSIAIAVGLSYSLRSYLEFWIGLLHNKKIFQSDIGRVIDWCWLSLVTYLLITLA